MIRKKRFRSTSLSKEATITVTNVHELRDAVFNQDIELKDIEFLNASFIPKATAPTNANTKNSNQEPESEHNPLNHEVIKLIEKRVKSGSKPGARGPHDDAILALSMEGGGMRGSVSAGMASAIAVLGLSDAFDTIYGSSAGSVVGAYMVSRQMCIDVYTDVLTTAKTKFVSKQRLASSLATNFIDHRVLNTTALSNFVSPAMNISYVLDSIMCPEKGLRPLDVETFKVNDQRQQLRVVTSTVRDGKMETHCLGSRTGDFFDDVDNETGEVLERATTMVELEDRHDNRRGSKRRESSTLRHGLFACLETSMLVPCATGSPKPLLRNKDAHANITTRCFDAFCFEPIPYRSAVAEGATHVLALKSRPDGSPIGTKPGLFEKYFAPTYFDSNDMPEVADYFENGGQQYVYTEDYLTLDEGKLATGPEGVLVPPQKILYGVERDEEAEGLIANRQDWKRAHLYPLAVPEGKPELSVLSVDEDEVLEGVRHGFAAAFDILAPIANVQLNPHLNGERVSELLFSSADTSTNVLEEPVHTAGDIIMEKNEDDDEVSDLKHHIKMREDKKVGNLKEDVTAETDPCPKRDALELLNSLPGFHQNKMESLSRGLYKIKHSV